MESASDAIEIDHMKTKSSISHFPSLFPKDEIV